MNTMVCLRKKCPVAAPARRAARYRRSSWTVLTGDARRPLRTASIDDLWLRDRSAQLTPRVAGFGWSHGVPRVSTLPRIRTGFAVVKQTSLDSTALLVIVRRKRCGSAILCAPMSDSDSFAARLVAAREAAGLSQARLLAKLADLKNGTAQSTLSSWEKGKTEPAVGDIRDLARACGCSADFLLGLTDAILGNMGGRWIVDDDLVDEIRQKRSPPKGRFARPIPARFHILSSTELDRLEDDLFNNRKK